MDFSRQIQEVRARIEELRRTTADGAAVEKGILEQVFDELQVTLEELMVADKELRRQDEANADNRKLLEAERRRYYELFDFAPDGYLETSAEGVICEANRGASDMLRVPSSELIGKPLKLFIANQDHNTFMEAVDRLNSASETAEIELRIKPGTGQQFYALLKVRSFHESSGVALRWMIRDITRYKEAERAIQALNADLERRVRNRTVQLEAANALKDELIAREQAARLEAEAATRAKDEFLATVSHEIRTPLNAILGWTHILQSNSADDETRSKGLQIIERNAYSQSQIISDLLDISRIVAGTLHLEPVPVDLASIVSRSIEMMRPAASQKGIEITTEFNHNAQQIIGDADRLQQVVLNLLSNAIKFIPEAGRIEMRLETEGGRVRLVVTDTGVGIKPEFLPFVFDRFSQGDPETTRKIGGLGLGLSIVRHLVRMHGGNVEAISGGADQGATFIVTFPAAKRIQETFERAESIPVVEADSSDKDALPLKGINVLVVDDEADAREMLGMIFKDWGAQVMLAESCSDALRIIKQRAGDESNPERPDVLVADIAMPEEDGFDLIRQVRDLPKDRGGNIPAIALTAYAGADDRQRIMLSGFQNHLAKPVSLAELANVVTWLVGRR